MHKLAWLAIASFITALLAPLLLPLTQEPNPLAAEIDRLMTQMTPADKVGQLFLVPFAGNDIGADSDIADLVVNYKVGGVILSTENRNIANTSNTPFEVASMCNGLQTWANQSATNPPESELGTATPEPTPFIPLVIAIDHEGDNYPYTSLINGFTVIPSSMVIGATWDPENARLVGRIVGRELRAVGVNMLLGPSLDVLETPQPSGRGDLGTRTFGGDPFWVGEMGQAYVQGIHQGAQERADGSLDAYWRVAVIAKHFPGHGGSDRRSDLEVAVVDKSLEELKRIELAPFFAVMQPEARTDGLMTAHIQYRGFQGNIREKTKPISLDATAMSEVLGLVEVEPWRQAGGIIVSDALGVRAVQRYYNPALQEFNGRQIAREAFLAGNDLLQLSQYGLWGVATWENQLAEIKDTITYFQSQYDQDNNFRARVDESVRRILKLKLQMYPNFALDSTQVNLTGLDERVGQGQAEIFQVAQQAITLISPRSPDFLPPPPAGDENIVIFTDDRRLPNDCPAPICQPESYFIPRQKLEQTILNLYGPNATNQIRPTQLQSFTFSELAFFLSTSQAPAAPVAEETPTPPPLSFVEIALDNADWIVFAILDIDDTIVNSAVVKQFLDERDDLARAKRVVVLAFNSPYYLDKTEISKLQAYYGVYSRINTCIEASMRALFGEGKLPHGAPPVTVAGINYYLKDQTEPDPNQVIDLTFAVKGKSQASPATDGTPSPTPIIPQVNDILVLRTGIVLDHNGHIVPDGTPVEFLFYYPESPGPFTKSAVTKLGIAETEFPLDQATELAISARSGAATKSTELNVVPGVPPEIVVPTTMPSTPTNTPTPTPTPTETPAPIPTETSLPTPTPTESPTPTITPAPTPIKVDRVSGPDLILLLLTSTLIGGIGFLAGRNGGTSVVIGLRVFLWCWILGFTVYSLYGLGVFGDVGTKGWVKSWSGLLLGILGGIPPLSYVLLRWLGKRSLPALKNKSNPSTRP